MTSADSAPTVGAIECETAVRRLWDFLDGEVPARSRDEVELHLRTCERCPPHFDFARSMRGAIAASGADTETERDEDEALRTRVRAALDRAGAP